MHSPYNLPVRMVEHEQHSLSEPLDGQIVTPRVDDCLYRLVTLENGLKAVLVHDATCDKAAAACDVGPAREGGFLPWEAGRARPPVSQQVPCMVDRGAKDRRTQPERSQWPPAAPAVARCLTTVQGRPCSAPHLPARHPAVTLTIFSVGGPSLPGSLPRSMHHLAC